MDLDNKTANFDPVSLAAFTYDGKLLGLPYSVENVAFICNKDLVSIPPTTYEELKTMAKEMQGAGKVKQFFALVTGDAYHSEPINTAFGGYIFGQNDTGYNACDVGLDSQGAVDYLTWIDGMVKDGCSVLIWTGKPRALSRPAMLPASLPVPGLSIAFVPTISTIALVPCPQGHMLDRPSWVSKAS